MINKTDLESDYYASSNSLDKGDRVFKLYQKIIISK
jgi:hypothetical protein